MDHMLERLGALAVRRHWIVIAAWLLILGGLLGARQAFGGQHVNDYTVAGSDSAADRRVPVGGDRHQGRHSEPAVPVCGASAPPSLSLADSGRQPVPTLNVPQIAVLQAGVHANAAGSQDFF